MPAGARSPGGGQSTFTFLSREEPAIYRASLTNLDFGDVGTQTVPIFTRIFTLLWYTLAQLE